MSDLKFITKVLNAPYPKNDPHGSLHFPIYDSAAFEFESAEDIANAFQGKVSYHAYSRHSNPPVEYFEQTIRNSVDAHAVISFSSGMAAISNLIIAIASSGENIVTTRYLFGNSYSLFKKTLPGLGIKTKFIDIYNPIGIRKAIDKNTRAIFIEAISNQHLKVADIKMIAGIAEQNNILLITVTTTLTLFRILKMK